MRTLASLLCLQKRCFPSQQRLSGNRQALSSLSTSGFTDRLDLRCSIAHGIRPNKPNRRHCLDFGFHRLPMESLCVYPSRQSFIVTAPRRRLKQLLRDRQSHSPECNEKVLIVVQQQNETGKGAMQQGSSTMLRLDEIKREK